MDNRGITGDERIIGRVCTTPLIIKGVTWFPFTQIIAACIATVWTAKKHPDWSTLKKFAAGAATSTVVLGSEWCHNLAHAAAAAVIHRPMDEMRIIGGMPRVVYSNINDETVSPDQHIIRALGGPIFNALLLAIAYPFKRWTYPSTLIREIASVATGVNLFLCTFSLIPIPGFDGGPILKWSLVKRGRTIDQADTEVRKINKALSVGLSAGAAVAVRKRHWLFAFFLGFFAIIALLIGIGRLKEK
jgi:Zn-dependent protease